MSAAGKREMVAVLRYADLVWYEIEHKVTQNVIHRDGPSERAESWQPLGSKTGPTRFQTLEEAGARASELRVTWMRDVRIIKVTPEEGKS